MKIIFVITDRKYRPVYFILDDLRAYTLKQMVSLVGKGRVAGVHVVWRKEGPYIRSNPNATSEDNLHALSVSGGVLAGFKHGTIPPALLRYLKKRDELLKDKERRNEKVISIDGARRRTEKEAVAHLSQYRPLVRAAAKRFNIDPYLLGAVLIDEYCRLDFMEEQREWALSWVSDYRRKEGNLSVGIAQVKIETARELIREGYYTPNGRDPNLLPDHIARTSRKHLYDYISQPVHSVALGAARIRQIIDSWKPKVDLSKKPDIVGTLYSLPSHTPHPNPKSNPRGRQIGSEFYRLAKKVLGQ